MEPLSARLEELERRNRLLTQGLKQAERIRELWGRAVEELKQTKRALRRSEAFLQRVLTAAPEPMAVVGANGRIVLANRALAERVGRPAEQLVGTRLLRLLRREDRRRVLRAFAGASGRSRALEAIIVGADGEPRLLAAEWSVIEDGAGQITEIVVAAQDVTERARAEAELRSTSEELRERNRELSILNGISACIGETISLEELSRKFLGYMDNLLPEGDWPRGIFVVEAEAMRLVAHRGGPDVFGMAHQGMKVGQCHCGRVALTGQPIVGPGDTQATIVSGEERPHLHLIIPLKAKGRVVGVFFAYLPEQAALDERRIRLFTTIGEQLGMAIDNARLYEETQALSLHDALTGLPNRRSMELVLNRTVADARRYGADASVILFDVDHFKQYNDSHGHLAGDEALVALARVVKRVLRQSDFPSRYGGEEFLVVLPHTSLAGAVGAAERIRRAVEAETPVTVSLGVAALGRSAESCAELVLRADRALYRAKNGGRNRVEAAEL